MTDLESLGRRAWSLATSRHLSLSEVSAALEPPRVEARVRAGTYREGIRGMEEETEEEVEMEEEEEEQEERSEFQEVEEQAQEEEEGEEAREKAEEREEAKEAEVE